MGSSTEELTSDIATTRDRMATDIDALQDRVSPHAIVERRKHAVRSRVGSLRDKVMGRAHEVRSEASSMTSTAKDRASGTAHQVADRAHAAADTAQEEIAGSPLAAGLVAFGAGAVIAGLLPASQKEAEVASAAVDTAREHHVADEAKQVGREVAQGVKERARDAASEVKETASGSAEHLKDESRSAAEHVRSDARAPGSRPTY